MRFEQTSIDGLWIVEIEKMTDDRGYFGRTFCQREFSARGLCATWVQTSVSFNARTGTLRGLHFQAPPAAEIKLVRCEAGAIFDVVVDLRRTSPSYRRWVSVQLTADNGRQLYIPKGLAHGFQTLADNTQVHYQISEFFQPALSRGLRWNDSELQIPWPRHDRTISPRDRELPPLAEVLESI